MLWIMLLNTYEVIETLNKAMSPSNGINPFYHVQCMHFA